MENPLSNESETPTTQAEPKTDVPQSARPAIRTLHSDVAASVHNNNISITKIALAQQAKNADLPFVAEEKEPFWSGWSIGTIVLVIGGILILVGSVFVMLSRSISLPLTDTEPPPTLVPVIERMVVDTTRMTRTDIKRAIDTFTKSDYRSPIELEALILSELTTATTTDGEPVSSLAPVSFERFLERMGSQAPGRLVRSTGPDMTIGRVGDTPFLITETTSYETTFADMLEWEPIIAEDLSFITRERTTTTPVQTTENTGMFGPVSVSNSSSTDSVGTTTPAASTTPVVTTTPTLPEPIWKDIIVRNKDARALVAHDGTILLLYAFPKAGFLVITQKRETFMLIVDALNAPVFGI